MNYNVERGKTVSHKGVTLEAADDGSVTIKVLGHGELTLPEGTAETLHILLPSMFTWSDHIHPHVGEERM